ncbi:MULTISPECIES: CcdC protein domain-containing protein [Lacticaseibacillus]|uniref:P-type ATPase A domain-containing protein n=1 Tax=Lacticaseibacillus casei DSM 20011 = JCM 1134 = ATCC 393 TaxID=1423732 RepID=A0AAD1ANW9_LACCA|nr:ATPase [Lacticaseibacillus casei]MBI6597641.1 ATPase [Lacticaseibacillus casei]MBO1481330.1 ATPase [Lacticaseibacillus casei]MBO2416620.1 ATPase [Lacticaseibacillus casei]MCK2080390.1 ATPase [Lacticaseibacillus casei]MDZ5495535.1 ATPase [Lacticaseibacillus casei]
MLMMISSGLTRYEAQRAQKAVTSHQNPISKTKLFLPLLAVLAGVSSLISFVSHSWLLTAIIAILLGFLMAVVVYLITALTRHQSNPQQSVLVVREGLVRQVQAQDLVVGDVLMLTAGEKLPVDVALSPEAHATLPSDMAGLLVLLNQQVPAGMGVAGAVMATDAQATVTAVWHNGLLDRALMQLANQSTNLASTSLAMSAVTAMTLALKQICCVARMTVSILPAELFKSKQIDRAVQIHLDMDFARHATLVGAMKHHSKTSDFWHNQDPVS